MFELQFASLSYPVRFSQNLQFIIKLSFLYLWRLRNQNTPSSKLSIMEVIEYKHPECKDLNYLEEADCKFLIIMDSFDCYQAALDWKVTVTCSRACCWY